MSRRRSCRTCCARRADRDPGRLAPDPLRPGDLLPRPDLPPKWPRTASIGRDIGSGPPRGGRMRDRPAALRSARGRSPSTCAMARVLRSAEVMAGCARGPGQVQLNRPGFRRLQLLLAQLVVPPWLGRGAAPQGHCSWHQHRAVSESEGASIRTASRGQRGLSDALPRLLGLPGRGDSGKGAASPSVRQNVRFRPSAHGTLAAPLPCRILEEAAWSRSPAARRQLFEGCFILEIKQDCNLSRRGVCGFAPSPPRLLHPA